MSFKLQELRKDFVIERSRRGDTQRDIEEKTGLSQATVSKFERGNTWPNAKTIVDICDYLDRDPRPFLDL